MCLYMIASVNHQFGEQTLSIAELLELQLGDNILPVP
jgi:hypothetical protein